MTGQIGTALEDNCSQRNLLVSAGLTLYLREGQNLENKKKVTCFVIGKENLA